MLEMAWEIGAELLARIAGRPDQSGGATVRRSGRGMGEREKREKTTQLRLNWLF